jgi:hypothetical protein
MPDRHPQATIRSDNVAAMVDDEARRLVDTGSLSMTGHRSGGYVKRCLDLSLRSIGRCAGC